MGLDLTLESMLALTGTVLGLAATLVAVWAVLLARKTDRQVVETGKQVDATLRDVKTTLGEVENVGAGLSDTTATVKTTLGEVKEVGGTLRKTAETLDLVEQATSTRSIGVFPFLDKIVDDVFARATRSIVVFSDFPAYGGFSDPDAWNRYREFLHMSQLRAARDAEWTVRVMCLSAARRIKMHAEQFPESFWNEADLEVRDRRADPTAASLGEPDERELFLRRLDHFLKKHRYPCEPDGDPDTHDRFLERVEWMHKTEEEFLQATVIDEIMPLFFWIADDDFAVFAVTPFPKRSSEGRERERPEGVEVGFLTHDKGLIAALHGIFNRYEADRVARLAAPDGQPTEVESRSDLHQ